MRRTEKAKGGCMLFARSEIYLFFYYLVAYSSSYHEKAINALHELD